MRESCRAVMERARHVRLDTEAIDRLARRIQTGDIPPAAAWDSRLNFQGDPERVANYVLALDALNFCFWASRGQTRWRITFEGQTYDGYWALTASLTRALLGGFDLTDAAVMAAVTPADLWRVFAGDGEIPLLTDRVNNLREAGAVLGECYGGRASKLIRSCDRSAEALVERVVAEFPSFDDRADYHGREVRFFKRAQILVVDLAGALAGSDLGVFTDLDSLTAFADYKVPQVLREVDVLQYEPALAAAIARQDELPAG
ncbi:MAG: hypothetical protein KGR26_10610, partial [Cyanobacteria bacterium REEB65]|nr:hypothetical protein [Cyanobacteria bacterium REEB65]